MCFAKIAKIDDSEKWWYYGCDSCFAELVVVDNIYRCDDCKEIVSYPDKRYHNLIFMCICAYSYSPN